MALTAALVACGGGGDGMGGGPGSPAPPITVNHPPVAAASADDQFATVGLPYSLDIAQLGLFSDPDGDPLRYEVRLQGSPPGLRLAGTGLSGTPTGTATVGISVTVSDGRGGSATDVFQLQLMDNIAPVVALANGNVSVGVHSAIDYDALQGGATFRDAEHQPLSYQVTLLSAPDGFTVQGTRVTGSFEGPGFLEARIEARDPLGATATDEFALVVPQPIASRPSLPAQSFAYEDAQLPPTSQFHRSQDKLDWDDTNPNDNLITNAGATLGRVLFYDRRLSITNTHACGSCHQQAHGFASAERFPSGALGRPTRRNPMALVNVRFNNDNRYFSDERVGRLESLVVVPIEDREELGNNLPALTRKLAATDFYPPLFQAAFGSPDVTPERITKALAQFLRSMVSYRTRFDRANYSVAPDPAPDPATVLSPQEQRGFQVYLEGQCFHCHMTSAFEMPWPANNGLDAIFTDPGQTGGRFRAASLRNIAVSAPYMHDGRFTTLREVIDHYDSGIELSDALDTILRLGDQPRRMNLGEADKQALEAFLDTLTDEAFLSDPKFSDPFQ